MAREHFFETIKSILKKKITDLSPRGCEKQDGGVKYNTKFLPYAATLSNNI